VLLTLYSSNNSFGLDGTFITGKTVASNDGHTEAMFSAKNFWSGIFWATATMSGHAVAHTSASTMAHAKERYNASVKTFDASGSRRFVCASTLNCFWFASGVSDTAIAFFIQPVCHSDMDNAILSTPLDMLGFVMAAAHLSMTARVHDTATTTANTSANDQKSETDLSHTSFACIVPSHFATATDALQMAVCVFAAGAFLCESPIASAMDNGAQHFVAIRLQLVWTTALAADDSDVTALEAATA
jgi:hypothetical protein